mmetsp:Transcript_12544/g.37669  ORF Transcript_12544/g.37669 Transcript_12544/m.37669 type:complete len:523 (-) Transcript_12544:480-2048(-)
MTTMPLQLQRNSPLAYSCGKDLSQRVAIPYHRRRLGWQRAAQIPLPHGMAARTLAGDGRLNAVTVENLDETGTERRRVAIFVEPSPFSHVSGMKNRFETLIQGLRAAGDDVMVFTPDRSPPAEYHGARVFSVLGFTLPQYKTPTMLLSAGLSVRVLWHLIMTRPHVIHASSPGPLVLGSILYAKLLAIPLVVSYHTHIPEYIPLYFPRLVASTFSGIMWSIIRFCARAADLTLVTSKVMREELVKNRCPNDSLDVWQRGVDTEAFHPRHRSQEMRERLSGGCPDATVLIYVGRLGFEKSLPDLKRLVEETPGAVLALVGDGPCRAELEAHFAGLPVVFMGLLQGDELSAAYASADVFVMPSESETLGFVVLEAMASSLPVIAVAAGGLLDIITQPGVTGLLYPPGDLDAGVEATRRLANNAEEARSMGAAGRCEVERWGWAAATARLRGSQYRAAITAYHGKHLWRPLREFVARGLRLVITLSMWAVIWTARQLDYARPFRPEAHYEYADLINGADDPLVFH